MPDCMEWLSSHGMDQRPTVYDGQQLTVMVGTGGNNPGFCTDLHGLVRLAKSTPTVLDSEQYTTGSSSR